MRERTREERETDEAMGRLIGMAVFSGASRSGAYGAPVGSMVERMPPEERAKLGALTSDHLSVSSARSEDMARVPMVSFRQPRAPRNVAGG